MSSNYNSLRGQIMPYSKHVSFIKRGFIYGTSNENELVLYPSNLILDSILLTPNDVSKIQAV